ncbi:MAG TPA: glycosyltransferase family 2 protein, partial [Arcobacter sp.]|nr:glycosyltransferase family 2 protein [Arcobacter sp.]
MSEIKNYPLVSICMPLYNAEEYIEETLTRLIEQSYSNIEIIIVDDHSQDTSMAIVKNFESQKVKVFTNKGKGACSARNYALSQASGEFIKFHDSDDYCSEKLIEFQVKALQKGTKTSVVFSPLKLLYTDGSFVDPVRTIYLHYENAFNLQVEIMNGRGTNVPHCYMMPIELVKTSGGCDETVRKNQDGEYFSRVLANADKAFSVTDEFAIYRKTGTG